MVQNHNAVFRQMHIRLDSVRSDLNRALERTHRILRVLGLVATVRNGLRKLVLPGIVFFAESECEIGG